jgi:hypothetical protein
LISLSTEAQDYVNSSSSENIENNFKIFTGGDFGLQLGTVNIINLSPLIGYRINNKTSIGVGGIYKYYSDSRYQYYLSIYGIRAFARYLIFNNLFAHVEAEELNVRNLDTYFINKERLWISNFYIGGGYRQSVGTKSFLNLLILWNINDSGLNSYSTSNPVIRVTFDIGL